MKRKLRRVLAIIRLVLLFFFTQSVLLVVVYRFFPPPVTPLMLIRVGEQILDGKKIKLYKDWEPLESISPKLVQAVVASEDQRFLEHNGFDFKEIKRAIQSNKKKGRKIRGASTISQQVAKNVFLWPSRSWLRKGLEVYFTVLIEVFWTKERIMEVYLNVIEMGNGVYGAEAASFYYYSKPAKKLTQSQAVGIAAILPNPRKWSPNSGTIAKRKAWISRNMNNIGEVKF